MEERNGAAAGDFFDSDDTRQDAAILKIARSCEQAIDLANHVIRIKPPTSYRWGNQPPEIR
ncbi:MAG: hypothetical protein PF508_01360 [Spirochaeta sp.]|jgi:hypothetical protein|nr:hypothetical protein [Spirochaeta sp.]